MYEQPVLAVQNETRFAEVRSAIAQAFAPEHISRFLKRIDGRKLRAREFERVLRAGLLGPAAIAAYAQLEDADRGQVRELYLHAVEQVAPELRAKFLKAYAYY